MSAAAQADFSLSYRETTFGPASYAVEPDAQLMCRVRDGDAQAYALLLHRFQRPLIHFIERIVRSRYVAEELAQDVFLRVYRSRASYEPTAKFSTWLFRIATHVAINWLRDVKCERSRQSLDDELCAGVYLQLADRSLTAEQRLLDRVKIHEIRRAIDNLPSKQRAAVLMHKYQDLTYSEIAVILNCSEGAVKSLLFRAYERLRARLCHFSASTDLNR
jgi:RNA polymerase sigma-70 factor (ECF subfamily)